MLALTLLARIRIRVVEPQFAEKRGEVIEDQPEVGTTAAGDREDPRGAWMLQKRAQDACCLVLDLVAMLLRDRPLFGRVGDGLDVRNAAAGRRTPKSWSLQGIMFAVDD